MLYKLTIFYEGERNCTYHKSYNSAHGSLFNHSFIANIGNHVYVDGFADEAKIITDSDNLFIEVTDEDGDFATFEIKALEMEIPASAEYIYYPIVCRGYYSIIIEGNQYSQVMFGDVYYLSSDEARIAVEEEMSRRQEENARSRATGMIYPIMKTYPLNWKEECGPMGNCRDYISIKPEKLN